MRLLAEPFFYIGAVCVGIAALMLSRWMGEQPPKPPLWFEEGER